MNEPLSPLSPNTLGSARRRSGWQVAEDTVTPPGVAFLVRIKAKFYGSLTGSFRHQPETPSKDVVHRTYLSAREGKTKVPTMLICNEHGIVAESLVTGQAVMRIETRR